MSRIVLAWELGRNLGHVSRLIPLGQQLQSRGHEVLLVSRDIVGARALFHASGLAVLQAPQLIGVQHQEKHDGGTYPQLLLKQGWHDAQAVWGMIHSWIKIFEMFRPDVIVLDYAPAAKLAAHCLKKLCLLIGTGFELPPLQTPMPLPMGGASTTEHDVLHAEHKLLHCINHALDGFQAPHLQRVSELVNGHSRFLLTIPELDHYGPRLDHYLGPLFDATDGMVVPWPTGSALHLFAYLRAHTPHLQVLVQALSQTDASIICYAPDIEPTILQPLRNAPNVVVMSEMVNLESLYTSMNGMISYAPAGTVTQALLHGIPQLLLPAHTEAQITAQCIERLGAGLVVHGVPSALHLRFLLNQLTTNPHYKTHAQHTAQRYRSLTPQCAINTLVASIEEAVSPTTSSVGMLS